MATLVHGDDVVVLGEGEADEVPAVGLLAAAVEHDDEGIPGDAPFEVVEVHPVDGNIPVGGLVFQGEGDAFLAGRLVQCQPQRMRSH